MTNCKRLLFLRPQMFGFQGFAFHHLCRHLCPGHPKNFWCSQNKLLNFVPPCSVSQRKNQWQMLSKKYLNAKKCQKYFFCQECQNVIVAASMRKTLKNSCQAKFELNQKNLSTFVLKKRNLIERRHSTIENKISSKCPRWFLVKWQNAEWHFPQFLVKFEKCFLYEWLTILVSVVGLGHVSRLESSKSWSH